MKEYICIYCKKKQRSVRCVETVEKISRVHLENKEIVDEKEYVLNVEYLCNKCNKKIRNSDIKLLYLAE